MQIQIIHTHKHTQQPETMTFHAHGESVSLILAGLRTGWQAADTVRILFDSHQVFTGKVLDMRTWMDWGIAHA